MRWSACLLAQAHSLMSKSGGHSVMGVKTEMGCWAGVHEAGALNPPKSEGMEASGKTSQRRKYLG